MKAKLFFFFLLLLIFVCGKAQVPANALGLNPPGLRWRQLHTDRLQIIFPASMDSSAQRVANLVHHLWDRQPGSIGAVREKISIVLHNQTVIPNGFVTVGPFRSEFYLTPPQSNVSTTWLDHLTIHEYRHVQQFNNATRGVSKFVKQTLGSWAWGGMVSLALPRWFLEGDAVAMETALTPSGRGRSPLFDMEYRAILQSRQRYSYEKAGAGSFRDFVPDWYKLGYLMTSYARDTFGTDIWKSVIADAGAYKGLFFPFSKSLKRQTGLSTSKLYQQTLNHLSEQTRLPGSEPVITYPRNVVHETNPVFTADGSLLFYREAFDQLLSLMETDARGKTSRLTLPGVQIEHPQSTLSAAGNLLVWAELAFDPRWGNKNYSVIRLYDRSTGAKKRLTTKSKYFSPALHPDGTSLVAAEVTPAGSNRLVVLSVGDGQVLQTVPNPEGYFFAYPQWLPDSRELIAVARKDNHIALLRIDPESGQNTALTPFLNHQLFHPVPVGKYILFSAAYTGIQNIFAVPVGGGDLLQVTDSPIGTFQPACSPDGQKLAYSEFSAAGYRIKTVPFSPEQWTVYRPESSDYYIKTFVGIAAQEGGDLLSAVPSQVFPTKKFNRFSGLIQPHSLLPLIAPPVGGLRLLSDNTFSTLSAELGTYYNFNENRFSWEAGLTYAEQYPEISLNFRTAERSAPFFNFSQLPENQLIYTRYNENWTERDLSVGLGLPLNLSRGSVATRVHAKAEWHHISIATGDGFFQTGNTRDTIALDSLNATGRRLFSALEAPPLDDGNLQAIALQLQFSSFQRLAPQQLYPKWGIALLGNYRRTISRDGASGSTLYASADLYLPAPFRNHGIRIQGLYQESRMLDNYRFSNIFFFPRGYNSYTSDRVSRLGFNYAFPVAYPDLALGPLVFLKRIKANLFADMARMEFDFPFTGSRDLYSSGAELTFDIRLLRLLDVNLGVRYSYLWNPSLAPGGQVHQFDFLLLSIRG